MKLAPGLAGLLAALAGGYTLKAHRDIDGCKVYRLHALDGGSRVVRPAAVSALCERGLIDSNKKFPAATFWLTDRGKAIAAAGDGRRRSRALAQTMSASGQAKPGNTSSPSSES